MVGKLLGGGLVLLGTALLCRAETRTRRQQTERLAELSAALSEMAAGIRSLRRTLPCLLRQQTRRPLCGAYFGAVLEGLESGQPLPDAWADAFRQLEPPELLAPLVKTLGIALVSRLGTEICRDAGQGAMAAVLETAGAFGAVLVSLPLVRAAWELLRSLV